MTETCLSSGPNVRSFKMTRYRHTPYRREAFPTADGSAIIMARRLMT
jgi:hypothetical protein